MEGTESQSVDVAADLRFKVVEDRDLCSGNVMGGEFLPGEASEAGPTHNRSQTRVPGIKTKSLSH